MREGKIQENQGWQRGASAARATAWAFGRGLRRSTVAHFARKVRGANIVAAKHEFKIQQSYAPERWSCSLRVRGPHFASKVSYNAGAATDDCAGLCNFKHLTYKVSLLYIRTYSQSASVMRVISSSQSSLSGLISTTRAPISSATRRAVFPLYSFWMNTTRTFSRRHS